MHSLPHLVGESRTPPYNDSKAIYAVAESIVYRGGVDVSGPGEKFYAQHPLLPSAIHIPGVVLRKAIARGNAGLDKLVKLVKPMTSHLGTQFAVALGCLVFFRFLRYLGISWGGASLGTLFLAFATFLPIYARTAWSEVLQARYLLFLVPPLLLPAAFFVDDSLVARKRQGLLLCAVFFFLGFGVQFIGASQYWDHFRGLLRAQFHACIPAHRSAVVELAFSGAEQWYRKPSWDWWIFDFVGRYSWAGHILFASFLLGLLAGVRLWVKSLRAALRPTRSSPGDG